MTSMTKAKALAIQSEQIEWYAKMYGDQVRAIVANATTADALEDGKPYDIVTINRHIPRGAFIEALIGHVQDNHD